MIVLRALAQGAIAHAGVRATEWIGAVPLIGMGYVLNIQKDAFAISPSFTQLSIWFEQQTWVMIVMLTGIVRLLALFINGYFRSFTYSPTIRFCASMIATVFWAMFTLGFFIAWQDNGGALTGIVAYGTISILELRNIYVSRVDMTVARGAASVRDVV